MALLSSASCRRSDSAANVSTPDFCVTGFIVTPSKVRPTTAANILSISRSFLSVQMWGGSVRNMFDEVKTRLFAILHSLPDGVLLQYLASQRRHVWE